MNSKLDLFYAIVEDKNLQIQFISYILLLQKVDMDMVEALRHSPQDSQKLRPRC